MEIIILMCWCIWSSRNDWLFNEEDPNLDNCKSHFKEFALVILRAKPSRVQQMEAWLDGLNWCFTFLVLLCVVHKLISIKKISRGDSCLFFKKNSVFAPSIHGQSARAPSWQLMANAVCTSVVYIPPTGWRLLHTNLFYWPMHDCIWIYGHHGWTMHGC
jgi:hypothetical protein